MFIITNTAGSDALWWKNRSSSAMSVRGGGGDGGAGIPGEGGGPRRRRARRSLRNLRLLQARTVQFVSRCFLPGHTAGGRGLCAVYQTSRGFPLSDPGSPFLRRGRADRAVFGRHSRGPA